MSSSGSWRRVAAVVVKDLHAFSRDRFFLLVSVLGLVFYVAVLWMLPASTGQELRVGVTGAQLPAAVSQVAAGQGVTAVRFPDRGALRAAVAGGAQGHEEGEEDEHRGVAAGIVLPEGYAGDVRAGREVTVGLVVSSGLPEELRATVGGLVRELSYLLAGEPLPVTLDLREVLVGAGQVGEPLSLREQMRPLFAFLVLLVESFALASLVAGEIQQRTATAMLVTPLRVSELLSAKAAVGAGLAFVEASLLLGLTGGLAPAVLPVVLLGAVLVTGVGLVAGSLGRDLLGIIGWSMLFVVPLAIPTLGVLFPAGTATWVQALPSHGFLAALVDLTARRSGLGAVAGDLLALTGWSLAALAAGVLTLRHRVATL